MGNSDKPATYIKMLLVDDEPLMRQGFRVFFNWEKYKIREVLEAQSGFEAIHIAEKEKPDIVITDILMPEIDGLELIAKLKLILPKTIFIVISGYDNFSYAKQSISLGVLHYLVKPIHAVELDEVMLKSLNIIDEQKRSFDKSCTSKPGTIIDEISSYITENIHMEISLNKIAERFYYNPSYLCRLFKQEMNINFLEYVNRIKIQTAMELIDTSGMTAFTICEQVGYHDYKYFASVFRKFTGMTPHEYKSRRRSV